MIQIHVRPTKIEKVVFVTSTQIEEDRDLTVWQAIRPLVVKIDKLLQRPRPVTNSTTASEASCTST
jgi:hypothetical protein